MLTNKASSIDQLQLELEHLRQVNCSLSNALAFSGHELRNGLQRLSLAVDRYHYRSESLNPQQQQMIADMTRNIKYLQRMAVNWMRLAYIQDGQFEIHPSWIDPLAQLIKPLVTEYGELLAERAQTCS
jgi:signal transduction histidine kinase